MSNRSSQTATQSRVKRATPSAERVYVSGPKSTFDTGRYDALCAHVRRRFPLATVLVGRDICQSVWHWHDEWPALAATLSRLVLFADKQRWIGYGARLD